MSQGEGFLEARGGSSWRQFVKTQAGGAALLEDPPEVPNRSSVGSRWTRGAQGWTYAQTGVEHVTIRRLTTTNKRKPGAKHLLHMVPRVSNPQKM